MTYKLNHPDTEVELDVDADQVPMYLSQGWQTKPGAKLPADDEADEK